MNHRFCWVNSHLLLGNRILQEDLGMSFAVLRHIRDQFKVPGHGDKNGMKPCLDTFGIDLCCGL